MTSFVSSAATSVSSSRMRGLRATSPRNSLSRRSSLRQARLGLDLPQGAVVDEDAGLAGACQFLARFQLLSIGELARVGRHQAHHAGQAPSDGHEARLAAADDRVVHLGGLAEQATIHGAFDRSTRAMKFISSRIAPKTSLPIAAFTSPDRGRTTMRLGKNISDLIFLLNGKCWLK